MPVPQYFQKPLSLEVIATYVWDLSTVPRQRAFEMLAVGCDNEMEKEKLIEFTQPEGLEDLYNYTSRPRRTILEVLQDFPHATSKLTIPILFELFSPIKPRSFSIASCSESGLLEILVAVVEYKTILKELRKGLCSNYLKNLEVGDCLFGQIKSGTFKIPNDAGTPLVMVGPGTGVAPFRSILMQRAYCHEYKLTKAEVILFFGCRNKEKDFHCQEDFARMETNGIVKSFCAFSRDQEEKIYVQHVIKKQSDLLRRILMEQNAVVLIAGSSKNMPQAVKEAFAEIVGSQELISQMENEGRYQEETWS